MTYNAKVHRKQGGDELVVGDGGKVTVESGGEVNFEAGSEFQVAGTPYRHDAYHLNNAVQGYSQRFTVGQVNTGQTIVFGEPDGNWEVLDVALRAIGGAGAGPTHINLIEETSGDVIFSAPIAALTQDTIVKPDTAGVVTTKLFRPSVAGKDLLLAAVGGDLAGATHLDVMVLYRH
jgi:hypothetical protein